MNVGKPITIWDFKIYLRNYPRSPLLSAIKLFVIIDFPFTKNVSQRQSSIRRTREMYSTVVGKCVMLTVSCSKTLTIQI